MAQDKNTDTRRTLSTDKIVETAIKQADTLGFEALTMRKLAHALGVTAMSLYNHVANKDDLLDLMLDRVVTEFERPECDGEWQEMMHRRAHSMRNTLLHHPWAAPLLISKITNGTHTVGDINATLGCLVNAGFSYAQADWARNAIDSHIYGYTMQESNFPMDPEEYRAAAAHHLPAISKANFPFIHMATTKLIEGEYDGVTQFDFGLTLIIEGLDRWRNDPDPPHQPKAGK